MRITQIYNNNVVGASDEKGREVILIGRGVGFNKKPGCRVSRDTVDKVFTLGRQYKDKIFQLLEEIPFEHLQIADEIITAGREELGKTLSENIYITLTDHLSFAVERFRSGINLPNAMLWEIKHFYGAEFKVGVFAVDLINKRLEVELGEDEAAFIALHFINAELDSSMRIIPDITELIRASIDIVRDYFDLGLDEKSLGFRRFTTHLRYLGQRILTKYEPRQDEQELAFLMKQKYPDDYECANLIAGYVEKRHNVHLALDDIVFLTVHIRRLTSSAKRS